MNLIAREVAVMNPQEKIISKLEEIKEACERIRLQGNKISLTSGCFDLLHREHLKYLCKAGEFGQLVVGVNSDAFVRKIKGDDRPIHNQEDRAFLLAGFESVRWVTIFDCDYDLIEAVAPDFYIASKTSNVLVWSDKRRIEILNNIGSKVIELDSAGKHSTTKIIERVSARI